ncbi:MAG TPA: hypothetical protein VIE68_04530 [Gemmatimonadota bacterium]|jgi:hypothetical protein
MSTRFTLAVALGLLAYGPPRAFGQGDDALSGAVRTYSPGMSLSSDPALVHRADFNGDGQTDVAAVLESEGKSALVIFNASRSGYRAYPLYATLPAGPWRLDVVPPGRHRVLGAQGTIDLTSPAIELVFPGRSSAMYVWEGNRYQVYGTENH